MKAETKVVIVLLLFLLLAEVVARIVEPHLSKDVQEVISYGDMADSAILAREDGCSVVVLLGNSLTRTGIDAETLRDGLIRLGYHRPKIFYLTPDSTGINEWLATYRKHFVVSGGRPDLLLVGTGPGHLLDQPVRSPEKLAAFHVSRRDSWEVFCKWLSGAGERSRFLLASVSRLFANRERIRPRLFYSYVPGFEETSQRINANETEILKTNGDSLTITRLNQLLGIAAPTASDVFAFSVPLPEPYQLPAVAVEAFANQDVVLIETGCELSWPLDAFPDGYHLSHDYSVRFTKELLRQIASHR
ncbi:MAG: hypothetical protein P1U87_02690 [Verrucomicrobiales bacterium]|nr:hypothetical protein [Verrucomicrobiales bacterium]